MTYKSASNFKLALKAAQKGLSMAQELNNKNLISNSVNFIGVLYNNDKKYQEAVKTFRYLAEINRNEDNHTDYKKAFINLALSYRKLNLPDS
jgi:tetratricopeptide (TPR) repeat protein